MPRSEKKPQRQFPEIYQSPPVSRAFMLRVGVQFCTMLSSAASTSCLMKALVSPALCSRTLAVASSSWSIPFCRLEYNSPKVTTAMRDTPERRFRTCRQEVFRKPNNRTEPLPWMDHLINRTQVPVNTCRTMWEEKEGLTS